MASLCRRLRGSVRVPGRVGTDSSSAMRRHTQLIPNITSMICAYIVFRCIEAIVKEFREGRGAGGIVVVLMAPACICTLVATVPTISCGASVEQQMRQSLNPQR
jgi:hypothetical protein